MTVYPGPLRLRDPTWASPRVQADPTMANDDVAETADEIEPQHARLRRLPRRVRAHPGRAPQRRHQRRRRAPRRPDSRCPARTTFIQLAGRDRDSMLIRTRDVALAMNFEGEVRRKARLDSGRRRRRLPLHAHGRGHSQLRQALPRRAGAHDEPRRRQPANPPPGPASPAQPVGGQFDLKTRSPAALPARRAPRGPLGRRPGPRRRGRHGVSRRSSA